MHPFRKLILISLGRADSFEKTPSHGDWHLVFKMARQQTLLGVLFDAVQRLPQDQRPPESIYEEWQELSDKIAGIHQRHEARVRELEAILGRLGLHGCILKGTALSHLYPIPERRMCGDIDVWLKGTHDEILDTLEKAGYHSREILYQECKTDFFEDVEVEVHFHPSKMYHPGHNAKLQRCLEGLSPIRDDVVLTEPDAHFNAIFCMAHMYRHYLEGGIGMRQMLDYYYVLRQLDPADRQPVLSSLRDLGMERFTAAVMFSMQFNFGLEDGYLLCPPDPALGRKLIEDMLTMGNFGRMDKRNRARQGETRLGRFIRKNKRVFANFKYYPGEIIWSPYARIRQFVWRLFKGYL